jgi:hypothetical protein
MLAHRIAYDLVGPIPDGLTLDHLCRSPASTPDTSKLSRAGAAGSSVALQEGARHRGMNLLDGPMATVVA